MHKITVINYEVNNLFSVCRAFESIGVSVTIATDAASVSSADRLVLPGVGSFMNGMERLRKLDLIEPIQEYARSGRPLLGFCLGLQLLAAESEEFGRHRGLGIIDGKVVRLPQSENYKIPHIGWNSVYPFNENANWDSSILHGIPPESDVYFVHSYFVKMQNDAHILAATSYSGIRFPSVIAMNNIYGCQFHPEKSGSTGLAIVRNFATRT